MATSTENVFASAKNSFQSSIEFELCLRKKLKWNNKDWSEAAENGTRLNKLCHSLNYWKHKLKPAMEDSSLVFTLFDPDRDVKFDVFEIITEIESLVPSVQVRGVSQFRNPHYLCLHFKNKEERDSVESVFKMLINSFVVYVSWALSPDIDVTILKVHWLPLTLDINVIKEELQKYVTCVENTRISLTSMSGREMPTGKLTFKVNLKKDVKAEDIPHLTNIANMEALITISGRKPLCLNCDLLGHISRDCKLRFCQSCRLMIVEGHNCSAASGVRSFAQVARKNEGRMDSEDCNNEIYIKAHINKITEKEDLTKKISGLEVKIQELEKEGQIHIEARMEKKRKAQVAVAGENQISDKLAIGQTNLSNWASDQDSMLSSDVDDNPEEFLFDDTPGESVEMEATNDNDGVEAFKNANRKKKNIKSTTKIDKVTSKKDQAELKSYGKPVLGNARRLREQQKFDKCLETREFIFKDVIPETINLK